MSISSPAKPSHLCELPRRQATSEQRAIPAFPLSMNDPVPRPIAQEPAQVRCATLERSAADELVNALTHGAGLMLSVVGALVMAATLWGNGDAWRIAGCGVFVASMVAVYAASTLSHSISHPRWKYFLRQVDQGVIYLLVVGTYTPFGLAYLRTTPGWILLGGLWAGALIGFLAKVVFAHRVNNASVWTYVVLGLLPAVVAPSIWQMVPAGTAPWMILGGLCYLGGTFFLIFDARVRHFHAVWHLLVIAGSMCHFLGVLSAVAQAAK